MTLTIFPGISPFFEQISKNLIPDLRLILFSPFSQSPNPEEFLGKFSNHSTFCWNGMTVRVVLWITQKHRGAQVLFPKLHVRVLLLHHVSHSNPIQVSQPKMFQVNDAFLSSAYQFFFRSK